MNRLVHALPNADGEIRPHEDALVCFHILIGCLSGAWLPEAYAHMVFTEVLELHYVLLWHLKHIGCLYNL